MADLLKGNLERPVYPFLGVWDAVLVHKHTWIHTVLGSGEPAKFQQKYAAVLLRLDFLSLSFIS